MHETWKQLQHSCHVLVIWQALGNLRHVASSWALTTGRFHSTGTSKSIGWWLASLPLWHCIRINNHSFNQLHTQVQPRWHWVWCWHLGSWKLTKHKSTALNATQVTPKANNGKNKRQHGFQIRYYPSGAESSHTEAIRCAVIKTTKSSAINKQTKLQIRGAKQPVVRMQMQWPIRKINPDPSSEISCKQRLPQWNSLQRNSLHDAATPGLWNTAGYLAQFAENSTAAARSLWNSNGKSDETARVQWHLDCGLCTGPMAHKATDQEFTLEICANRKNPKNGWIKSEWNGTRYGGDDEDQWQGLRLISNSVQIQAERKNSWVQIWKKSK